MRNPVNNNYGNVTVQFEYANNTGYAIAYTGRETERLWMPAVRFPGCKNREEAELRALYHLINGDARKDTYAQRGLRLYSGFNKNARVQLIGFDAFEKGIKKNHKTEGWNTILSYFGKGKDGLKFDLIRINDTFSGAIYHAETYGWTAINRAEHAASFKALVNGAIKEAKVQKAAQAKAEVGATAKAESALEAKCEAAIKATAKKEAA